MTKELEVIQRRVLEQGINLGESQAFTGIQSAFTQLSGLTAGLARQIGVEQAQTAGATAAFTDEQPRKLAPGLTAATRAYNNAYNDMTTNLISTKASSLITQAAQDVTAPGSIGPTSAGKFKDLTENIIAGTLESTPRHLKADVGLALMKKSEQTGAYVMERVQAKNLSDIKVSFKASWKPHLEEYKDAILVGTEDDKKYTLQRLKDDLSSFKNLTGVPQEVIDNLQSEVDQTRINSELQAGYDKAMLQDGEEGAAGYIVDFITSSLGDLTPTQKEDAKSFLLNLNAVRQNEMNVGSAQGYNNIKSFMSNNPGAVQNAAQVDALIAEQAEKRFMISQAQQTQLKQGVIAKNKAAMQRAATNADIQRAIFSDDVSIADFSKSDMNNYFFDRFEGAKAERDRLIAAGDENAAKIPDWQVESDSVIDVPVPIEAFNNRLNARLTNGSAEKLNEGLRQYMRLKGVNSAAVSSLPGKTKAFADIMAEDAKFIGPDRTIEQLIKQHKESVLDADEATQKIRSDNLTKFMSENPDDMDSDIRSAFNIRSGFRSGDPIPDEYRATYQKILDGKAKYYPSNRLDLARKESINQLKSVFSKDEKYAGQELPVTNAISKLPFAGYGNIVDNQLAQWIQDDNELLEGDDSLGYKTSKSDKMPDFPKEISEIERFEGNYAENGFWKKIAYPGGEAIDRKMYFKSPNYINSNPYAPNVYQVFWGDTGKDGKQDEIMRPYMTLIEKEGFDGQKHMVPGQAMLTLFPPSIYTPKLMEHQQNNIAPTGSRKYAATEFEKQTPRIGLKDYFLTQAPGATFSPSLTRQLEERQKEKGAFIEKEAPKVSAEVMKEAEARAAAKEIEGNPPAAGPINEPASKAARRKEYQPIIKNAAKESGVREDWLVAIADIESNFKPKIKNPNVGQSASGLFQFTNDKWSDMVKKYGKKYNIKLGDKHDPRANSIMGALSTKENAEKIKREIGREPTLTDLYMLHFAGPTGGIRMLKKLKENPSANVSAAFSKKQIDGNRPKPTKANPNPESYISGTLKQFYEKNERKLEKARRNAE